jgi:outer membrane receptor for ferrienterochelin and colicins
LRQRPRAVAAAALAVILLGAAAASADSSADEADARFRRGTELYKQRRYEEALLEFFTSNRLAPNRNVVFNLARSFEALGRFDEAYRYYSDFLAAEPTPDDRAAAEARLAELAPRVALVTVASTPPGASVYVDRKDLGGRGETPLTVALTPGPHLLLLEKEGFEPAQREVTLERGRRVDVALPLVAIVGTLRVVTRPPGELRVDRPEDDVAPPDAASTPATLSLPPGRHAIEVRAPGHHPLRRLIEIGPREEQVIDAALEPLRAPSGTVALAGPAGARVRIDGETYGVLPLVGNLEAGRHRVEVLADGYEVWSRQIDVARDGHTFVEVELVEREPEVRGATRAAQRLGQAPASVSLVSADELRAFGYETLADVARGVRGLYESDDRNYRAVGIRGFSRPGDYTNRVLVVKDGHVWNDALLGSGFVGRDFAPDLSDLSRVEIVRGPGSAFYGQGAFFGVINTLSLGAGEGPLLAADAAILDDGGSRAHVRGALSRGDRGASLSVSAYANGGRDHFFEELRGTPSGGLARDADAELALAARLRLRQGAFFLDAAVNRREKEVPTATFETVFDPAHAEATGGTVEQTTDDRAYLELRYEVPSLLVRAYADHAAYLGLYPYDSSDGPFVSEDRGRAFGVGGEARVSLAVPRWNRLTIGAELARQDLRFTTASDPGGETFRHERAPVAAAVYAVDEVAIGEAVRVTAGARVDRLATTEEVVVAPRVAVVLGPYAGGRTKLVLGQAHRAPTEYEQHYADDGLTQVRAGPLDAERITTAELEHTHELGRGTFVLASVFGSEMEKLIGLVEEEDSGLLVYENSADTVRALGAELEARVRLGRAGWIGAAASLTDLEGGDALTRANSLPLAVSGKALWHLGRATTLAFELVVNGPRPDRLGGETEAMALLSVVARGAFTRNLRWQVGVFNALDWRYHVPVGDEFVQRAILQDPRRVHAALRYEF